MEHTSGLKFYSLGVVVEAKSLGSDIIKVSPREEIGLFNGLISEEERNYKTKSPNAQGVVSSDELEGDVTLLAQWISFNGGNRTTAPDVQANETVMILTYADTDEYYWTPIFREPGIRRLETVRYSYGNLKEGLKEYDADSSYFFEVSTHEKFVKLHTSKSDGEPFEYNVTINTFNGTITVGDDAGNNITIDSQAEKLQLVNTTGTSVTIDKENIILSATNLVLDCDNITAAGSSNIALDAGTIALSGGTITANGEDLSTDLQ